MPFIFIINEKTVPGLQDSPHAGYTKLFQDIYYQGGTLDLIRVKLYWFLLHMLPNDCQCQENPMNAVTRMKKNSLLTPKYPS